MGQRFYASRSWGNQHYFRCWAHLLAVTVGLLSSLPAHALQDNPPQPAVRITAVDTANFPEVTLQVYGENLGDLATLALTVTEDGSPITPSADTTAPGVAGTQTAIVFDASGNVTQNGPTNKPVHIEVGETLRRVVRELGVLSSDRDFLTTISFGPDKQPTMLHDWSQDHQAVVDSVYQYKPVEGIGNTPIDGILKFTLEKFKSANLPAGQVQSIVLFSDGVDVIPQEGLFEAQRFAADARIRIHTVMIGRENADARSKMEDLARLTGGTFVYLSSIEALDTFWPVIAQGGTRRTLTYRSQQAKPIAVEVAATLPSGTVVRAQSLVNPPVLAPAKITIVRPPAGLTLERRQPELSATLTEFDPKQMVVQAVVEFPDSRTIRSLEYEVAGRLSKSLTTNFDQPYVFDISSLGAGEYNFRASMVDELGIRVASEPLSFQIAEVRLPTPTATPDATATAAALMAQETRVAADATATQVAQELTVTVVQNSRLSMATIAASVFGVAMLGFAIYVLSNRDRRKAATQIITGTVAAVTQPFMRAPRRGGRGGEQPRAQFRLLEGGEVDDAPQTIPLTRSGITIGRDPTVANIVLSDRHISKLHCRVVEDANSAGYRLLDEGSTSGTYINDREVDINGQVLRHGDIIAIGPLQYQFEMPEHSANRRRSDFETTDAVSPHDTEPFLPAVGKGKTEPYQPGRDK